MISCSRVGGLIVLGALLSAAAVASEPRLARLSPPGGQRGTEVDVVLNGQRLADAAELLFDEPGLKVLSLEAKKGEAVHARLAIAQNCRLGMHALWLRTASGVSNVVTFAVGALPETQEQEPNSEFDSPQSIALGAVVNGVVQNEDVDYFVVEAKKGERISCEIEALRLGRTFFDPYIAILDPRRFELATSDDSALLRQDGLCSIVAPEDGRYVIEVRESAYQGSNDSVYRLHVGRFPRPTAVYPAGGKPGETLEVRWLGDPRGEHRQQVTLPQTPDAGLLRQDEQAAAPSPNPIRLSDLTNILEAEPNDEQKAATAAQAPAALNGIIQTTGDVDYFRISLKKGEQYDFRVYARSLRTPLDATLAIYRNGKGRAAFNDDDSGEPDSYLRFSAPEDDDYYVAVTDHLEAGGADYVYRVEVTPVTPELNVSITEFDRYRAVLPEVPRGNRTTILVSAQRRNFGGALQLELPELPPGVTLHTVPMPAARSTVPVVLSAADDAPLSGAIVPLVLKPTDEKVNVEGHFRQQHWLVLGQNNRDVWSYWGERLPVVVTEPVPFSIEVVAPRAPLVQSGSMNLKVVAKRSGDFKEPISLRLLENPPGVSSSGAVTIAPDQTEAEIPLTANGNAATEVAQLVVLAQARVNGGLVRVCSQIFPLEVTAPYFAFQFQKAAAEQGKETELAVQIEQLKEFAGKAKVELVGLPGGVTTEPAEIDKTSGELQFPLKIAADARPGRHTSLVCRAVFQIEGEPVTQTFSGVELRIDKPLPPKKAETKPAAQSQPQPVAAKQPAQPLSRLEQLRQQNQAN